MSAFELAKPTQVPTSRYGYTFVQRGSKGGDEEALTIALDPATYQLAFLPTRGEECPCPSTRDAPQTVRIPWRDGATTLVLKDPQGQPISELTLPTATEVTPLPSMPETMQPASALPRLLTCSDADDTPPSAPAIHRTDDLLAAFPTVAFPAAGLLPAEGLQPLADALSRLEPQLLAGLRSVDRGFATDEGMRCCAGHLLLDTDFATVSGDTLRHDLTRAVAFCAALGLAHELSNTADATLSTGDVALPDWYTRWSSLWREAKKQPVSGTFRGGFAHPLGRERLALDIAVTLAALISAPERAAFLHRVGDALDQRIDLLVEAGLLRDSQRSRARCAIAGRPVLLELSIAGVGQPLPIWLNEQSIATVNAQTVVGYQRVSFMLTEGDIPLRALANRLTIIAGDDEGDLDDLQLRAFQLRSLGGEGYIDDGPPTRLGDAACADDPNCQADASFYLPAPVRSYERIFDGWGTTP